MRFFGVTNLSVFMQTIYTY